MSLAIRKGIKLYSGISVGAETGMLEEIPGVPNNLILLWVDAAKAEDFTFIDNKISSYNSRRGYTWAQPTAARRPVYDASNTAIKLMMGNAEHLISSRKNLRLNTTAFIVFQVKITDGWNTLQTANGSAITHFKLNGRVYSILHNANSKDINGQYNRIVMLHNGPYAISAQIGLLNFYTNNKSIPSLSKILDMSVNYGTAPNWYNINSIFYSLNTTRIASKGADYGVTDLFAIIGNSDSGTYTPNTTNLPVEYLLVHEVIILNVGDQLTHGTLSNVYAETVRQYLINKWSLSPVDFNALPV